MNELEGIRTEFYNRLKPFSQYKDPDYNERGYVEAAELSNYADTYLIELNYIQECTADCEDLRKEIDFVKSVLNSLDSLIDEIDNLFLENRNHLEHLAKAANKWEDE